MSGAIEMSDTSDTSDMRDRRDMRDGDPRASASALYVGRVMHQRLRPARHGLAYRVFSLLLDIDELPVLDRRLRLFSFNRFNLFSLHESDYGTGQGAPGLRAQVEQHLANAGLQPGGTIRLLSMPRILGHVFNPLSVFYCHAPDGALQAVLYEVHNTFGERHGYLIPVDAAHGRDPHIAQRCDKRFHVSPFMGLDMHYDFGLLLPGAGQECLRIDIDACDAQGPLLHARLEARRRPLGDAALMRVFLSHPLLTLKVVGAIHWEALRLWIKGLRLHPRPAPPAQAVTINPITKARDS